MQAVMALIREYDRQEREMMKLKGHELGMIGSRVAFSRNSPNLAVTNHQRRTS
jgi:hypothetical protein